MGDEEIYHVIMSLMITAIVIIFIMLVLFVVYHLYWWFQRKKQREKDNDESRQGLLRFSDRESMIGGELGDELEVLPNEEIHTCHEIDTHSKDPTDKID